MPGPAPKPFALRVIQGTNKAKNYNIPKDEQGLNAEPVKAIPKPPEWLSNVHAISEWNRLGKILIANGLLTETSIMTFAHLCAIHGRLVQLWSFGETPTGFLISQYRALQSDFGITPGAAAKMRVPTDGNNVPSGNRFANNGRKK